jgi:hypothetical protein
MLADRRCVRVVSIDPRPTWQPDDRLGTYDYPDNSTDRMLGLLQGVPEADLSKLQTIEAGTESIGPSSIGRPDFCFIDGEHTHAAALRDARFCRAAGARIIAFHDCDVVATAILQFMRESRARHGFLLRSSVFVVELHAPVVLPVARAQLGRPRRGWLAANGAGAAVPMLAAGLLGRRLRDWLGKFAARTGVQRGKRRTTS